MGQVIIENINVFPDRNFASFKEFEHYFLTVHSRFSEENLNKVLEALISFSNDIEAEFVSRQEYQMFLDDLRGVYVDLYYSERFYINLSLFLDLHVIVYPELWAKFEFSKISDKYRFVSL